MKKILVILLAAILCLTIVACTEEPVETNEPTDAPTVEVTETETETETATETETETETEEESREVDVDEGWQAIFGGYSTDVDADDFTWVEGDAE